MITIECNAHKAIRSLPKRASHAKPFKKNGIENYRKPSMTLNRRNIQIVLSYHGQLAYLQM